MPTWRSLQDYEAEESARVARRQEASLAASKARAVAADEAAKAARAEEDADQENRPPLIFEREGTPANLLFTWDKSEEFFDSIPTYTPNVSGALYKSSVKKGSTASRLSKKRPRASSAASHMTSENVGEESHLDGERSMIGVGMEYANSDSGSDMPTRGSHKRTKIRIVDTERKIDETVHNFIISQTSNPYAHNAAKFAINFYYGLLPEHGGEYDPVASHYLLNPPGPMPGRCSSKEEQDTWKHFGRAQYKIWDDLVRGVSDHVGWDVWEASRVLEADQRAVYREGKPASWHAFRRLRSNQKNKRAMIHIPGDIMAYCLLFWYGKECLKDPELDQGRVGIESILEKGDDVVFRNDILQVWNRFNELYIAKFVRKAKEYESSINTAAIEALNRERLANLTNVEVDPADLQKFNAITGRAHALYSNLVKAHTAFTKLGLSDVGSLRIEMVEGERTVQKVVDAARTNLMLFMRKGEVNKGHSRAVDLLNRFRKRRVTDEQDDQDDYECDLGLEDAHNIGEDGQPSTMQSDDSFGVHLFNHLSVQVAWQILGSTDLPFIAPYDVRAPQTNGKYAPLELRHMQVIGILANMSHFYAEDEGQRGEAYSQQSIDTEVDMLVRNEHKPIRIVCDDMGGGKTMSALAMTAEYADLAINRKLKGFMLRGREGKPMPKTLLIAAFKAVTTVRGVEEFIEARTTGPIESNTNIGTFANTGEIFPPLRPHLIIVPRNILRHWVEEAERLLPSFPIIVISRAEQSWFVERVEAGLLNGADVVAKTLIFMTPYVARDAFRTTSSIFLRLEYGLLIVDEIHMARNKTITKDAIRRLSQQAAARLGLTASLYSKSVLDSCHIADALAFEGVANMDDPDLSPPFIKQLLSWERARTKERRKRTAESAATWVSSVFPNAQEVLVGVEHTDELTRELNTRAHADLMKAIGPMVMRRPRTALDSEGRPNCQLGKLVKLVIDCPITPEGREYTQEVLDEHERVQVGKRSRPSDQPATLRERHGAFYIMSRMMSITPGLVGFKWIGERFQFMPAKLNTFIGIYFAMSEKAGIPLADRSKFILHCAFPSLFPEITFYLACYGLYVRTISGEMDPNLRAVIIRDINVDQDHKADNGELTRITLASNVAAESVNFFRHDFCFNLGGTFLRTHSDQIAGRSHGPPSDPGHRWNHIPPTVYYIHLVSYGTIDDIMLDIERGRGAQMAEFMSNRRRLELEAQQGLEAIVDAEGEKEQERGSLAWRVLQSKSRTRLIADRQEEGELFKEGNIRSALEHFASLRLTDILPLLRKRKSHVVEIWPTDSPIPEYKPHLGDPAVVGELAAQFFVNYSDDLPQIAPVGDSVTRKSSAELCGIALKAAEEWVGVNGLQEPDGFDLDLLESPRSLEQVRTQWKSEAPRISRLRDNLLRLRDHLAANHGSPNLHPRDTRSGDANTDNSARAEFIRLRELIVYDAHTLWEQNLLDEYQVTIPSYDNWVAYSQHTGDDPFEWPLVSGSRMWDDEDTMSGHDYEGDGQDVAFGSTGSEGRDDGRAKENEEEQAGGRDTTMRGYVDEGDE